MTFNLKSVLYTLLIFSFSACTKTSDVVDPEPVVPVAKCKAIKAIYYDHNEVATDSVDFIYADSVVTRVNQAHPLNSYTFEYQNGKIIKRQYVAPGSTQPSTSTNYAYNSEGQLTSIMWSDGSMRYDLTYQSGKLNKVVVRSYYLQFETVQYEYYYTYTGDNISRITTVYLPNSDNKTTVVDYTYDSKENYFTKRPNTFIIEPFFFTREGQLYQYFFSKNNITSMKYNGNIMSYHTYKTNSAGDLTEILQDNKVVIRYRYSCQ